MVFNWFKRQYEEQAPEQPSAPEAAAESTPELPPSPATTVPPAADELLSWAKAAYSAIQQREVEKASEVTAPIAAESETGSEIDDNTTGAAIEPVASLAAEAPIAVPEADAPAIPPAMGAGIATEAIAAPIPTLEPAIAEIEMPELEEAPLTRAIVPPAASEEVLPSEEAPPTPDAIAPSELPAVPETTPKIASVSLPTAEIVPESEEDVPFWMRSSADREARIAAIAAPEAPTEAPAVPPAPAADLPVGVPAPCSDVDFDEGFLWSAEVLAAQGRRPDRISVEEITWLKRLRQGLDKTRLNLINQLKALVGQGPLDANAVEEIETLLLQADVGVSATDRILSALQDKLRQEVLPPEEGIAFLKALLRDMLDAPWQHSPTERSPILVPQQNQLNIWLIVGVNGAGKTTTIGKLAHIAQKSGYKTLVAAADTFRAAAVEQLKVWGTRAEVEVIANPGKNIDPASVVFDSITAAQARGVELLLVDTAGRLQNKKNLMDELAKIRRIIDKKAPEALVEALIVLDATLGQNGLRQAEVFTQAAQLTGAILTKLDGTAKGGVALAVVQQLGLPIRFIGAGEGIEDLRPFSSFEFVEALLSG